MRFGIWNLKTFFSISLGIHLFFFSIASILFPDFKIDRLPPLHVEVSLLPLVSEVKSFPEVITSPAVKAQIRKEEAKAPQKTKEEESAAKQEQEQKQKISAFPTTTKNIPLEEPTLLLPENRKWEMGNMKEEKAEKEPVDMAKTLLLPSDFDLSIWNDEKPLPLQENSSKAENLSIALTPSYSEKMKGTPSPHTDSKETSLTVSKLKPSSDEKIVFAQPRYAGNPKPTYPQEARKRGYEGEVLLKVEVLANGRVGRMEVKKSSGYEILDRSALTTVKEWKFIPANQGNGAIPCWVNIPIKFQLQ
jgi:TonB family protein